MQQVFVQNAGIYAPKALPNEWDTSMKNVFWINLDKNVINDSIPYLDLVYIIDQDLIVDSK